ncbi:MULTISPECIES: outer membrane lipoprotein chaperone LolA [unclassified Acinetobacter]|uniref:outer membrane lipoprotein chaperone LolA n=1 Tax=unclassified Acinetobacter TaxID=196816 RepID=UPI0029348A8A|nr:MULTISPECIES: outer membrane lipoprotein chaperone LolA [unclassified Acinetobacter]WOE31389.1 outer membrane lipoprotein chaperone LolA [Acinetobacter sp. SAAs470]WOE39585.1 outer membrane lipoprotein chaperone LolA [Acinetobacter sp. SAAs474]
MNMRRHHVCCLTLAAGMLVPAILSTTVSAATVAASEQQATASLINQLKGMQRLTANFEQTTKVTHPKAVKSKGLTAQHMNQTFKGVMKVERPGKFYWETSSPVKQTIVSSGKTVWIYDPDLQQAVRQSLDEQMSNTPALLLSGNTNQIMTAYKVAQPDQSKTYYTLTPKNKEGAFQHLTISFSAKNKPSMMVLQDSLDQTTYIKFRNVVVNGAIPAATFNFVPPKGTDIIDQ